MFAQVQLRALAGCSRHWRSYLVQWSPQGRCLVGTFLRVWLSCSIQLSFKPDQSHCPSCWKNPQQFWFPPDMRRTLCLHLRRMEVFPYKNKKKLGFVKLERWLTFWKLTDSPDLSDPLFRYYLDSTTWLHMVWCGGSSGEGTRAM